MNVDDFVISRILRFYHKPELKDITDYETVVTLGEEIIVDGEPIMKYPCPMQTIYLNEDGYPIDYERQRVNSELNAYYYKFTDDDEVEEDVAYEYVCPYEWKRYDPLPHDLLDDEEEEEEE